MFFTLDCPSLALQSYFMLTSTSENLDLLVGELKNHFPDIFQSGIDLQTGYENNTTGRGCRPLGVMRVRARTEIPLILAWCRQNSTSLYPISSGANWGYGSRTPYVNNSLILDLSLLNKIVHFDADLGLISIEPGVTQAQLFEFLQQQSKQYMVPTTGAGPDCSILSNALERGFGLTPYTDHFMALQSCEVILPNGETVGNPFSEMGAVPAGRSFRWGIGPHLTGLFSQSSLGIVVEGTFALAPTPVKPLLLTLQVKNDGELSETLNEVRETLFQMGGFIGGINLMNNLRMLTMKGACPEYFQINNISLPAEEILKWAQREGISPWMGIGNLFVPPSMEKVFRRELRKRLNRRNVVCRVFSENQMKLIRSVLRMFPVPPLRAVAQKIDQVLGVFPILFGVPSEVALQLTRWRADGESHKMQSRMDASNVGLIWFAPVMEFKGDSIVRALSVFQSICHQHNMDCPITLTCSSPRFVETTIPLLFNRSSVLEVSQAHDCFKALFEAGRNLGVMPYRVGSVGMELILENQTSHWRTVQILKYALDPKNILAPGRYSL